jgi:hypothetical protein
MPLSGSLFGMPPITQTEHSYEDVQLQTAALSNNLPPELAVVEMEQVKSVLHLDLARAKSQMQKFHAMDTNNDGLLTCEEFEKVRCSSTMTLDRYHPHA